jgi:hypothetical protein
MWKLRCVEYSFFAAPQHNNVLPPVNKPVLNAAAQNRRKPAVSACTMILCGVHNTKQWV